MTLPMVMPSNQITVALKLRQLSPDRVGLLLNPTRIGNPRDFPYAVDNGRFACWVKRKEWSESDFLRILDKVRSWSQYPKWVIVPDLVADCEGTFREWKKWTPVLRRDYLLALAVQDGMTVKQVRQCRPTPEVIFVGGTTRWKWKTAAQWCSNFPRVHIGRVNTGRMLWMAHRCGAESTDGTGWFHDRQLRQVCRYLQRSDCGLEELAWSGFPFEALE